MIAVFMTGLRRYRRCSWISRCTSRCVFTTAPLGSSLFAGYDGRGRGIDPRRNGMEIPPCTGDARLIRSPDDLSVWESDCCRHHWELGGSGAGTDSAAAYADGHLRRRRRDQQLDRLGAADSFGSPTAPEEVERSE